MDINGARTLARRVAPNGTPQRESLPSHTDPETALRADSETTLPVFDWLGIDRPASAAEPSPPSVAARRAGRRFSLRRG